MKSAGKAKVAPPCDRTTPLGAGAFMAPVAAHTAPADTHDLFPPLQLTAVAAALTQRCKSRASATSGGWGAPRAVVQRCLRQSRVRSSHAFQGDAWGAVSAPERGGALDERS
jgi:hypothetical protein